MLALSTLLAASLCVIEPVLCIVHCALWMQLEHAAPGQHAGQHAMVMPDGSVIWMDNMSMADHQPAPEARRSAAEAPAAPTCLLRGSPGHAPHEPLAHSFHELFWLRVLLLVIPLGITGAAHMPDSLPGGIRHRPSLRPPRAA